MLKALKKTPEGLEEAYGQMIVSMRSEDIAAVTTIFQRLCYSERLLQLEELLELLTFDLSYFRSPSSLNDSQDTFPFDATTGSQRLEVEFKALKVLRICRGLVIPQYSTPTTKDDPMSQFMDLLAHKNEEETQVTELRFMHPSAQKYLKSVRYPE